MQKFWKAFSHGPWPYWVGAIILGILNILILYVRKLPWGITHNLEAWAMWFASQVGMVTEHLTLRELLLSDGTYLNLGFILGALWSTLMASQARFRPIRHKKYIISALLGGILIGYGARIAYGCNIGGFLNGVASSSLTGWILGFSILVGVWIGAKIMLRFLV